VRRSYLARVEASAPCLLSELERTRLRAVVALDLRVGGGALVASAGLSFLPEGLARTLALATGLGLALLFLLRGLLSLLRSGTLVEALVERRELSPVARPDGQPLPQLVVRLRRRWSARFDGTCRPLACDGERQLIDVDRATYDACTRWTVVRLLYAPDKSLLLSTPVGAPIEPR
jgi:hypothetical protein